MADTVLHLARPTILEHTDPRSLALGEISVASRVMTVSLFQYYLWFSFVSAVFADYNITYDDADPSVTYAPLTAWTHLKVSRR